MKHISTGLTIRQKRGLAVGRSRAGQTTKLMALADSNGFALAVHIDDGNRHDAVLTDRTLDAAFVDYSPPKLVADKAWDSEPLRAQLAEPPQKMYAALANLLSTAGR